MECVFSTSDNFEKGINEHLEEMIHDVSEEHFRRAHVYDSLKFGFQKQLYP